MEPRVVGSVLSRDLRLPFSVSCFSTCLGALSLKYVLFKTLKKSDPILV